MKKRAKAVKSFNEKLNCAQAVVSAFSRDFPLNEDILIAIASGFGGGIAGLQKTCGAVTGGIMAIGLKYKDNDNQLVYEKIHEFFKEFKNIYNSIECIDILGYDTSSPEGREKAIKANLRQELCAKCVGDAVEIIDNL